MLFILDQLLVDFQVGQDQASELVRERHLEQLAELADALTAQLVEAIVQVAQLGVLLEAVEDSSEPLVVQVVVLQDHRVNQRLVRALGQEELLQGQTVALVEVVVDQVQCAVTHLAENGERHYLLLVALVHEVYVRVLCCIANNRVLRHLVEGLLVDMGRSLLRLLLACAVVHIQSLDQAVERVLEVV